MRLSSFGYAMVKSFILGVGPGQCGFQAVVDLLNRQRDCRVLCHGLPLLPWQVDETMRFPDRMDFIHTKCQAAICGDFGSSYLPYLEQILAESPQVKVLYHKRPDKEVIAKFQTFLRERYPTPTNYWTEPDDAWTDDPYWGRCYPKYTEGNLEKCIARYVAEYDRRMQVIAARYPGRVFVLDPAQILSTYSGLKELFDFLGIPEVNRQYDTGRWDAGSVDPVLPFSFRRAPNCSAAPLDPRRCVILTPYHSQIHPRCDRSLDELQMMGYEVRKIQGCTSIDFIRSQMATDALIDGFAETMWIDADVGFEPEDVHALRKHQLDVVSGIYAQKGKKSIASHLMPGSTSVTFGKEGGLIKLLFAATGFLLVRRNAYLNVRNVNQLPVCNETQEQPLIPFFEPMNHQLEDGCWYLAEDYAFSERLKRSSYEIWADTSLRLWHYGMYGYGWEDTVRDVERYESFKVNFGDK